MVHQNGTSLVYSYQFKLFVTFRIMKLARTKMLYTIKKDCSPTYRKNAFNAKGVSYTHKSRSILFVSPFLFYTFKCSALTNCLDIYCQIYTDIVKAPITVNE